MENQELSPPSSHGSGARPSLGFPLGTALLLLVIFSLSGLFSCCYHWDKLQSLRRSRGSFSDDDSDDDDDDLPGGAPALRSESPPPKCIPTSMREQQSRGGTLPVLMPGDAIPKFIALSCPREPPVPEKFTVKVEKPPKPPPRPLPVPLYV